MIAPLAPKPRAAGRPLARGVFALLLGVALAPRLALAQPAIEPRGEPPASATRAPATAPPVTPTAPAVARPDAAAAAAPVPRGTPAAGTARPSADDPVLEARLVAVTRELRCLVCQNESIADSHAPLAVDMRNQIREQLRSGMGEREVIAFMVERYGNFVRFRPPLAASTLALWFGPLVLLVAGLFTLGVQLRRRAQRRVPAIPLGPEEAARLAALADDGAAGRSR